MATEAITYHETHGVPPRLYHVTFQLGGDRLVEVACDGHKRHFRFSGRGYRPTSKAHRAQLIEQFVAREQREQPIEQINAELLHPSQGGTRRRRDACACDDRQLPAGDRS